MATQMLKFILINLTSTNLKLTQNRGHGANNEKSYKGYSMCFSYTRCTNSYIVGQFFVPYEL